MAWRRIGTDAYENQVYVNEGKNLVSFDPNGGDIPTADHETEEYYDIDSLLDILCNKGVCCSEY